MTAAEFPLRSREALRAETLQRALAGARTAMPVLRSAALATLEDPAAWRDRAGAIRATSVAELPSLLRQFEARAVAAGAQVHWARTGEEACRVVGGICASAGARRVTKSKSMVTEEIELNAHLARSGIAVTETDLGEYIIQLRGERPSHILAPSLHLGIGDVAETFARHHPRAPGEVRETPEALLAEARAVLRERFAGADVGITGANFLVAETGGAVIVTNEGNAELTAELPRTHVIVTGIEKVVATLEDAGVLLGLLARSAVGEPLSTYTTLVHGPRGTDDPAGPSALHIVLVDNGRSALRGTPAGEILRCIRCSACLNHCPVYTAIGGHAYGSVYSGPMGALLAGAIAPPPDAAHLPQASTLCGRCESVCPVRIRIPALLRWWRRRAFASRAAVVRERRVLGVWRWFAARPWAWRLALALSARGLRLVSVPAGRGGERRVRSLPGLAAGWTATRDLPAPAGETFQSRWRRRLWARAL